MDAAETKSVKKRVMIIGSTCYARSIREYAKQLQQMRGYDVQTPVFDSSVLNELETCLENKRRIQWADEVHVFWDGRSTGTLFDLGMCIALDKPIKIIYLNQRSLVNVFRQWEAFPHGSTNPQ